MLYHNKVAELVDSIPGYFERLENKSFLGVGASIDANVAELLMSIGECYLSG